MGRPSSTLRYETVHSFWHGESLSAYQLLCLRSFAAHGYRIVLYRYDADLAVPDWLETKNAAEILPPDRVLRYSSSKGRGGVVAHTNLFRYALLHQLGGWWTDPDVLLLKADLPQTEMFFAASGQRDLVSTNLLKFPSRHPILADAIERPAALEAAGLAQSGQPLLTALLKQRGLAQLCQPRALTTPIPWYEVDLLFDPDRAEEIRSRCADSLALDLHDEVWRGAGIPYDLAPPEHSFIDLAFRQYDVGAGFCGRMNVTDVTAWIEHLRVSIGLDAQLRALHARYRALERTCNLLERERDRLAAATRA